LCPKEWTRAKRQPHSSSSFKMSRQFVSMDRCAHTGTRKAICLCDRCTAGEAAAAAEAANKAWADRQRQEKQSELEQLQSSSCAGCVSLRTSFIEENADPLSENRSTPSFVSSGLRRSGPCVTAELTCANMSAEQCAQEEDTAATVAAAGCWEEVQTGDGRTYYWQVETDAVSWERPTDKWPGKEMHREARQYQGTTASESNTCTAGSASAEKTASFPPSFTFSEDSVVASRQDSNAVKRLKEQALGNELLLMESAAGCMQGRAVHRSTDAAESRRALAEAAMNPSEAEAVTAAMAEQMRLPKRRLRLQPRLCVTAWQMRRERLPKRRLRLRLRLIATAW